MPKISVITARKAMASALENPGLRQAYSSNIAMCIYDSRRKDGRLNIRDCNNVAEKLIQLIFDSKRV